MTFQPFESVILTGLVALMIGVSFYAGRKEADSIDYFLAGRSLPWWIIGVSIIATNTSTNSFVGMTGASFGRMGLSVANYEWIGTASLVFVAVYLLPQFLKYKIRTIPEFLEHRYSTSARLTMAVGAISMYVLVTIASVLYSGAVGLEAIFGIDYTAGVWIVGLIATAYTSYGGLKAVVWSDLLQGTIIILGGGLILFFALAEVGGLSVFLRESSEKLHLILPADHPDLPWTAMLAGIWIPNLYYWGLNQSIMQRALAAKSLRDGQLGVLFGAFLKLLRPFIVVIPGIIAFRLYGNQISDPEHTFFFLMERTLPGWAEIVMLSVIVCAILSTLDSRLSSASTIFTFDFYQKYLRPKASELRLVTVGRLATVTFALLGCVVAHNLRSPDCQGIFDYSQRLQGFISPGVVTVFIFGLLVKRAPATAAVCTMIANVPVYGFLLLNYPNVAFLNHMAITVGALVVVMAVITIAAPGQGFHDQPVPGTTKLQSSKSVKPIGVTILLVTGLLYLFFW